MSWRLFRRIGAGVVALATGAVVLVGLVATLSQTQWFRDRLRDVTLHTLSSLQDTEVMFGAIRGDLVSGFTVDSIAIDVRGERFVTADRFDLKYNLVPVFGRTMRVDRIALVRPTITLVRGMDGLWNFERMLPRASTDTAVSASPLDWSLVVNRFIIEGGTVALTDSLGLAAKDHGPESGTSFEYHRFVVDNVNLNLGGRIAGAEKRMVIRSFAGSVRSPAFRVRNLEAEIRVTDTEAAVSGLQVMTDRSSIRLSAAMQRFDLLGGISLRSLELSPTSLQIAPSTVSFADLTYFLPVLEFLRGQATLSGDIGGTFGNLLVRQLEVGYNTTRLTGSGSVSKLHTPSELFIDVVFPDAVIDPGDPLALMPAFDLPDFSAIGPADVRLAYRGTPLDFVASASLKSRAGQVEARDVALAIGGPQTLRYSGVVDFAGFDLGVLLDDPDARTSLYGTASISGSGTDLRTLEGRIVATVDSAEVRGRRGGRGVVSATVGGGLVRGDARLGIGSMTADLEGEYDVSSEGEPAFRLNGSVGSLNLADIPGLSGPVTDLSMRMSLAGSGSSLSALSLDGTLDVDSSTIGRHAFTPGSMQLLLTRETLGQRILQVDSDILYTALSGEFDLEDFPRLFSRAGGVVADDILRLVSVIDSSAYPAAGPRSGDGSFMDAGSVSADFALFVKNLRPLSALIGGRPLDGIGSATGWIRADRDSVSLSVESSVPEFFIGSADSGLLIQDARVEIALDRLTPDGLIGADFFRVDATAAGVYLNRTHLDSLRMSIATREGISIWSAGGRLGDAFSVAAAGSALLSQDSLAFTVSEIRARYNQYAVASDGEARAAITPAGMYVSNVVLRGDSEYVSADASLSKDGKLRADIVAERLSLSDLSAILPHEEIEQSGIPLQGKAGLKLTARGTLERPELTAVVRAADIEYRDVPLGGIEGLIFYKDSLMDVNVYLSESGGGEAPSLIVSGSLPMVLDAQGFERAISDRPVNLTVRSSGVSTGILDPFVPEFNDIRGRLTCDLTIGGPLVNPRYTGTFSVADASFLFMPNNIVYRFAGDFTAQGDKILVTRATMANIEQDIRGRIGGTVTITGSFALKNLIPGDFDLWAEGSLLVVKESTRRSDLSVYGDLFAEIGPERLHLTGSLDGSLLKGGVLVRNSSLVFPPTRASGIDQRFEEFSVPVITIDDTVSTRTVSLGQRLASYFGSDRPRLDSLSADDDGRPKRKSFMDGLRYDLAIEATGGSTEIRMIFNPLSGEELVAGINGKFTIAGEKTHWFGDLAVERAYYNFLKRFNATGSIRFRGDVLDPVLDIKATYDGFRTLRDSVGSDRLEKVEVTFKITGSRFQPRIDYGMIIDERDYLVYSGPKSNDIQSDAIQFIVYGTFPMGATQRGQVPADVQRAVGMSLLTGASSLLTGALSEFLQDNTGFINAVELRYAATSGGLAKSADIRLSGVLWSGYWRYGGQILDDPLGNANFSLIYSFDAIIGNPSLRNLMFELERRVEQLSLGATSDMKRVNSARLFYRFQF